MWIKLDFSNTSIWLWIGLGLIFGWKYLLAVSCIIAFTGIFFRSMMRWLLFSVAFLLLLLALAGITLEQIW